MPITKRIALLCGVIITSAVLLVSCVEEYKTEPVDAEVTQRKYIAAKTETKTITKKGRDIQQIVHTNEQYIVTLRYKQLEETYDNPELYRGIKKGDKIKVEYKKGYDKNGKLIEERLIPVK